MNNSENISIFRSVITAGSATAIHLSSTAEGNDSVVLRFDQRQKTRARFSLSTGHGDIGIDLPRGTVLRDGDYLVESIEEPGSQAKRVLVRAAVEQLLHVEANSAIELNRIAYHLGNRHVSLQIGNGFLRLELDHVLENMVNGLGGSTRVVNAAFDPETGAYAGGHSHEHAPHAHAYADSDQDPARFENLRHAPRIHDFTTDPIKPNQ